MGPIGSGFPQFGFPRRFAMKIQPRPNKTFGQISDYLRFRPGGKGSTYRIVAYITDLMVKPDLWKLVILQTFTWWVNIYPDTGLTRWNGREPRLRPVITSLNHEIGHARRIDGGPDVMRTDEVCAFEDGHGFRSYRPETSAGDGRIFAIHSQGSANK
jgi:hypothetical protein